MEERFSLKDHLFNKEKVGRLALEIHQVYPLFKKQAFCREVLEKFPELELKQRISWIRECLRKYLPDDYREALGIILSSLPPELNAEKTDGDFGDFIYAPYGDFVATYGREKKYFQVSLNALRDITKRFSAEDAIRFFINENAGQTLKVLHKWNKDSHYHVRRLVSEGTRPRLPWSQKISLLPEDTLPLLDNLFFDNTRYVTRSVANHLNDLSKSDPQKVLERLLFWEKSKKQNAQEMEFIKRHALRTLVKQGDRQALAVLGFGASPKVTIKKFVLKKKQVKIGDALEFSFDIAAEERVRLVIDYTLYFPSVKSNRENKKIYKLKTLTLSKGEVIAIAKKHPFRRNMTTRKLIAGPHRIEVQVNGDVYLQEGFTLEG